MRSKRLGTSASKLYNSYKTFFSINALGLPKGICHSHFSAYNFFGPCIDLMKPHTSVVATTCFFHVSGFFSGINAMRIHQTDYHVNPFNGLKIKSHKFNHHHFERKCLILKVRNSRPDVPDFTFDGSFLKTMCIVEVYKKIQLRIEIHYQMSKSNSLKSKPISVPDVWTGIFPLFVDEHDQGGETPICSTGHSPFCPTVRISTSARNRFKRSGECQGHVPGWSSCANLL